MDSEKELNDWMYGDVLREKQEEKEEEKVEERIEEEEVIE